MTPMQKMYKACKEYQKSRKSYYIVNREYIEPMGCGCGDCYRWEIHEVVSHKEQNGVIVAQSAFWGTDKINAGYQVFDTYKDAYNFKKRQNCLEVLYNEPHHIKIWAEALSQWLPDYLPIWSVK